MKVINITETTRNKKSKLHPGSHKEISSPKKTINVHAFTYIMLFTYP